MQKMKYSVVLLLLLGSGVCVAGVDANKVYLPYVQQLENEFEYQLVVQNDDRARFDNRQYHKFAYGQSLNDRWYIEAGLLGSASNDQEFKIDGYEVEVKLQLTEQGEYNNDWGFLFEVEKEKRDNKDVWEFRTTLIVLHEWQEWTAVANLSAAYETGSKIQSEFETSLSTQLKYRYRPWLEPAIEFFKSQFINAIGPSVTGRFRLGGGKNVFWNVAVLSSLDRSKPESTIRLNIEYEF